MKTWVPLLVVLMMLTLLVYHGTVGNKNLLTLEPSPAAVGHQVLGVAGASADYLAEHSSSHADYYVAALCTLLLGSFAGLFFGGARREWRFTFLQEARQGVSPKSFYMGTRPTPPFLQVFRL